MAGFLQALKSFGWLWRSRRTDLRCAHWLCHAVEDDNTLAATAGRERLTGRTDAAIDVLPVVRYPDVASGIDVDVDLLLQAATNIPAGWRNLITRFHAWWTVLGAYAAQLHNRTAHGRE